METRSGRITTADRSEHLHHKRKHYTGSGWKFEGRITPAGNQRSSSEKDKSKPQLKGSKQRTGTSNSGQDRTNKDIQPAKARPSSWDYGRDILANDAKSKP